MLARTRRSGEKVTLPLRANVLGVGFTEPGVMVLDKKASALK
jgi:hypothetical protein